MNRTIFGCILAASLTACDGSAGGGGNPPAPSGDISIRCAALANTDSGCAPAVKSAYVEPASVTPAIAVGDTIIDAGDIVRSDIVFFTLSVQNDRATEFDGYMEAWIDAPCGEGWPDWGLMPLQPFSPVPAGQYVSVTNGSSICAGMPLGVHHFYAPLYDTDGTTVLGRVVITFNLVG